MKTQDLVEGRRLLDALDTALDLSEPDRAEWLARLEAEEPPLGARVRKLLAAHEQAGTENFLGKAAPLPPMALAAFAPMELTPDAVFGAYRLVRELGIGGMGVVWLAERADGLFTRPVALKLPQRGLQARVFAERFAREREILAALDHPYIARLYDAGVTRDGQPFIAIEYVEGERIDHYCERLALGVRERIKLFIDVLHAVQYAHGQLVVHRDLKPANILVTGDGKVKLLDFGIARLLADGTGDETALTQHGARAHTPEYASPEQIAGTTLGITSDIYSLGVVLFELLAGSRPYKPRQPSAGALEHAIATGDVKRPSDAAIPVRLKRQLRGDLDTIVLTALAQQPAARFATCSAFADDLQRHLDGLPVLARPESRLYQLGKFVRRHRIGVGAAAVVLLAVLGSAGVAWVQAVKAREQATRADAVTRFLASVFERNRATQPNPAKARATTVRELLDLGRDELITKPPAEPAVAAELYGMFSEMYWQLGLEADSLRLDRARLEMTRKTFGELDPRTLDAQYNVGIVLLRQARTADETTNLAADLVAKLDRTGDRESRVRANAEVLLANALDARQRPEAVVQMQSAVDLWRRRFADDKQFPATLGALALLQVKRGEVAAARASIHEAIDAWSRSPRQGNYGAGDLYSYLGRISEANDELSAAEAAYRRAMELERERSDARAWQAHLSWGYFVRLLARTGRPAGVLDEGTQILERVAKTGDAPRWFDAWARSALLEAASASGDVPAMQAHASELERNGCAVGEPAFIELLCRCALLEFHVVRGNRDAAARLVNELEEHQRALPPQGSGFTAAAMWITQLQAVARGRLALGETAKAGEAVQEARRQFAQPSAQPFLTDVRLGLVERSVLLALGDRAGADTLTARLQARLAAHPDRALLGEYERALNAR